jgi:hypothetical protein
MHVSYFAMLFPIDNLHYRLIFDLVILLPFKSNKIPKFVVMCGKFSLAKFPNFIIIVPRAEIAIRCYW